MKLDTHLYPSDPKEIPALGKAAEEAGFDAMWVTESSTDSLLACALIAEHTRRITIGPAVAIAFPRSPMITAYAAWELADLSSGRFVLGLGTQVRGHVERRFSSTWDEPVARLREYLSALKAIFRCWEGGGSRLRFEGKYYNFSLMTPAFTPPAHKYPKIPMFIAGVNKYMCRLAGELCDGLHAHPFHSAKYLSEFVLPNVEKGLKKSGRQRKDFTLATTAFAVVGNNKDEIERMREGVRRQIAFYGSTRAYQPVLEAHGWGSAGTRLIEKAAKGEWDAMAGEVTEEMMDAYSLVGTFDDIADKVKARYQGLLDRVALFTPYRPGINDAAWRKLTRQFNG